MLPWVPEEFSEIVKHVRTLDGVWDALMSFVKPLGFDAVSYYHKPPPGSSDYTNQYFYSTGYDKSLEKEHQLNHTFSRCVFSSNSAPLLEPVSWGQFFETAPLTDSEKEDLKAFYCNHPANGIVVPVFGPNGRNGCVVMRYENKDTKFSSAIVHKVHFAVSQCHIQFCRIRAMDENNPVQLTAREQEVLTWVARGKSNSVIAEIVGISQHTVNGYLRRVYLKTQTSDRTTAALRAVGDGLIDF